MRVSHRNLIIHLHSQGLGNKEISDIAKVNPSTVYHNLKAAGLVSNNHDRRKRFDEDLFRKAWMNPNIKTQEMAKSFGMHVNTVRSAAKRLNLPTRAQIKEAAKTMPRRRITATPPKNWVAKKGQAA